MRTGGYPQHYNPAYNAGGQGQYYNQPAPGYDSDSFVPPYEAKPGYTAPAGKNVYGEDSKDPFSDNHEDASSSRV
jgi:hypothetical protein